MPPRSVLVTGLSGLIGRAVSARLEGRWAVRGLGRKPMPGVLVHQADIADLAAIRPAFEGVEAVVHLAAAVDGDAPWERVLRDNIVGTRNVLEAAREAGVGRVVLASSGATVSGWERDEPYRALVEGRYAEVGAWAPLAQDASVRPTTLYGVSKVAGEALGRYYAEVHGLSVICLRIGAVTAEDRPSSLRHFAVWCSQRDVAQMVERCLEASPQVRFEILYVTSDNRWGYRDLGHARAVVGYEPEDRAEDHRR